MVSTEKPELDLPRQMRQISPKTPLRRIHSGRLALAAFLSSMLWVLALTPLAGQAQTNGLTADQILQFQNRSPTAALPAVPDLPTANVLQPETSVAADLGASRLEQIMTARAGSTLRLFGYDSLGRGRPVTVLQSGAVQDDYVMGPGDEVVVSLRGLENSEARVTVGRDGQVVLPRINPISAAGRSFGSFRQDIAAAVRRAYVSTEAFVSLGRVRQVGVLVSGEVNVPGLRAVSGLSSVVDAIMLSGGIRKSGSLRNVRLQRGGREYIIDLYSVLGLKGRGNADMRLADGDRIVVPLLGPTVAISGLVRRSGIYELAPPGKAISSDELINLAGGLEVRGLYRFSVLRVDADGRVNLVDLGGGAGTIRDSEVLTVQSGADQTVNRAVLSGGTGLAGSFPVTQETKLSTWLKSPGAMGENPYTPFGLISRRDPRTLLRTLIAFTPSAVLNGGEDIPLQPDDNVRPLSVLESRVLTSALRDYTQQRTASELALRNPSAVGNGAPVVQNLVGTEIAATRAAGGDRSVVQSIVNRGETESPDTAAARASAPAANFQDQVGAAGDYAPNREVINLAQLAQQLGVDSLVLTNFLLDHQVTLQGAIRGPGLYLAGPSAKLSDVVMAAGGTANWADTSGIELISTLIDASAGRSVTELRHLPLNADLLANYVVKPRDEFRFNEIFNDADLGTVTVQGEVRFTGVYKVTRGERLSDLLLRAGGLTNAAYPYGTIFLRKSAAAQEREGYVRAAKEMQDGLIAAMARVGTNKMDASSFASMQSFVSELRNQPALGRISVAADPSVLAANANLDLLLEAGDVLYVPPRPSTVAVLGQVMQPGHFPYRPGATVEDYVALAGGQTALADGNETYIVLPDGSARRVEKSWLHFDVTNLPPGSSIIVPRDIAPFDLRQFLLDTGQILGQFAISVASVAVLSKQ